ncbi:MAG: alpha/beta fold hydrolase [Bacteroidetes bacterium]|nr:alpha/beta fold hydrolase [Bacteroidota bacterium]
MNKVISDIIHHDDHPPIAVDFHFPPKGVRPVPVIIFLHGLKGFKDWGHFPLIAEHFTRSGFAAVRFNFSMNGTTPEHPEEFVDLDAFSRNTYSQEVKDISVVIEDLWWRTGFHSQIDPCRIGLLGHSRGGGIALLAAKNEDRIRAVCTWAGVSDFEPRVNPPNLEEWLKNGVVFQHNSRTGQDMPQKIILREDFYANREKLDIKSAVEKLLIPQLIVHGKKDETVPVQEAELLHSWNMFSQLELIENANHTFGGRHPWEIPTLPEETKAALQVTINFFRENL